MMSTENTGYQGIHSCRRALDLVQMLQKSWLSSGSLKWMNVPASCKQNQKDVVMALLQVGEGKSGSEVEHLRRVTLPGLREGHAPAACGWRVDLPYMEAPGSTRKWKKEALYVTTGGKERAQNVGRPPKGTLIINIIYLSTPVLFVGLRQVELMKKYLFPSEPLGLSCLIFH